MKRMALGTLLPRGPERVGRWALGLALGGMMVLAAGLVLQKSWLGGIGVLAVGVSGVLSLQRSEREGRVNLRGAILRREAQPIYFRLYMSFWWMAVFLFEVGGILGFVARWARRG